MVSAATATSARSTPRSVSKLISCRWPAAGGLRGQQLVQILRRAGAARRQQTARAGVQRRHRTGTGRIPDAEQGHGRMFEARFQCEQGVGQFAAGGWSAGLRLHARSTGRQRAQALPQHGGGDQPGQAAQDDAARFRRGGHHVGNGGQRHQRADAGDGAQLEGAFRCHACPACGTAPRG
ncbi:hypothetical protein [Duganella sp. HH101]|uniref:hypothetical protein n=1 Tax=Duganella sp. HH101 TaxID=1781066 RepID=UPI001E3D0A0A|nr:hypothetical protein [Duganella sp. HH101]